MSRSVRRFGSVAAVLLATAIAAGCASAQSENKSSKDSPAATATDAPRDVPSLELSQSQREAIYQSISSRQAKKDTAPVGFRAAVGAHVPDSIKLEPLPKAVVELVPKTVDYEYAFVANQVLIVEPRSRTVVEVIH
jgi:PBP1b-binding outer membrane lipoprotein LpoB